MPSFSRAGNILLGCIHFSWDSAAFFTRSSYALPTATHASSCLPPVNLFLLLGFGGYMEAQHSSVVSLWAFLKTMFRNQAEQGSRMLSHEMNGARFTHPATSVALAQGCNSSQSPPHFKEFEKKNKQTKI